MALLDVFRKKRFADLSPASSSRQNLPTPADFAREARRYRTELDAAANFDEIYKVWKSFSFDYRYESKAPLSQGYKSEVLNLYRDLTEETYTIANEMSSTKQSSEDFEVGYPYSSKNLHAINNELAKTMQAIAAVGSHGARIQTIIEFGAGWGNLALPLAKAGRDVAVVDIEQAFLARIEKLASRDALTIGSYSGDFISVANAITKRYDAVIFQASFHHCLDFSELLDAIRDNVLGEDGVVFFLCEPIIKNYPFPWGLRYDGESVWAIMANKWLELGFDEDFFIALLLSKGFFADTIPGIDGYIGNGWSATSGKTGIDFERLLLPRIYDETFYPAAPDGGPGRFCRKVSQLPRLQNTSRHRYEVRIQNYAGKPVRVTLGSGQHSTAHKLGSHEIKDVLVDAGAGDLVILSETFNPSRTSDSGDDRELGVRLLHLRIV